MDSRAVDFEEAKAYAEENGLLFVETSAKTAFNVNDLFVAIGEFPPRQFSWGADSSCSVVLMTRAIEES